MKKQTRPHPRIGEVFRLDLEAGRRIRPKDMVRFCGFNPRDGWRCGGRALASGRTGVSKWFRLVPVGFCADRDKLTRELPSKAKFTQGQWLVVFFAQFPGFDCQKLVGVADASWRNAYGNDCFPYLHPSGQLRFDRTGHYFGKEWVWLVEVERPETELLINRTLRGMTLRRVFFKL
jgi:hypothetical protein